MSTAVGRRGGTTTQHSTFTGIDKEITVDTTKKVVVVHDGVTAGGFPMAREDHTHDGLMSTDQETKLDALATNAQLRDRATHTGTQLASTISDLTETIQDVVSTTIVSGSNVSVVYDDELGTITISATGGGGGGGVSINDSATNTTETWSSSKINTQLGTKAASTHTHDAATGSIAGFMSADDKTKIDGIAASATANATDAALRDRATHTGTQLSSTISDLTEAVQDVVGGLVSAGTNISVTYDDTANTFIIAVTGLGTAAAAASTDFATAAQGVKADSALQAAAIGSTVQAYDATLTALAGVTVAADKIIYATGADTFATTSLSSFMRTVLDDADATTSLATLGAAASGHNHAGVYEPVDAQIMRKNVAQVVTKPQTAEGTALTSATAWDASVIQQALVTVNGGAFTIANPTDAINKTFYAVYVSYTTSHGLTFGSMYKGLGSVTPTATAGKHDIFYFRYDGTNMECTGYKLDVGA